MAEGNAHEGKIRRVKRILYPLVKIIAYAGSSAEGYPKEIKIFFFLLLIDNSEFNGENMDMKKYFKEIAILIAQLLMFYVFPLTAGPTDAMGMVFLIIVATFVLAIIMGSVSKKKAKYVYPLLVSVLFIPSVFIYYNDSALIHSIWYLVISSVGLLIGALMQYFFSRK